MLVEEHEYKLEKETIIVSETDERGKIIYANSDFCEISQFSKDELIGKPHNIVRHPDMPKVAFADLWESITSGKVWRGLVKNRTKDGGFYWVNATVYKSSSPSNETRYISVRVRPTADEIKKAIEIYKNLD